MKKINSIGIWILRFIFAFSIILGFILNNEKMVEIFAVLLFLSMWNII